MAWFGCNTDWTIPHEITLFEYYMNFTVILHLMILK